MALDVLAMMRPGKRIVVTPGMIELGERQEELNREFGRKIAVSADVAIIVGQYNRDAITEGIGSVEGGVAKVHTVDTFKDAQALLGGCLGRVTPCSMRTICLTHSNRTKTSKKYENEYRSLFRRTLHRA